MSPPQPPVRFGPVDQLTMPMHGEAAIVVAKGRRAGIAGAGAEPGADPFGRRIEQADFQRARVTGDGERRHMRKPVEPVGAAHRHADAGNNECIADSDLFVVAAIRTGVMRAGAGSRELEQRDIGCGEMRE